MNRLRHCLLLLLLAFPVAGTAAIRHETVEYRHDGVLLQGMAIYDDAATGRRPGILIAHQWRGLGEYEQKRGEMLARLGYVAFCADIYGKGVRPATPQDAAELSGRYKADRALLRARVTAAWDEMRRHPRVDRARTAAIGYCFGGTTVLELARSGAAVGGVVSFHGGLSSPTPADAARIQARVLVLHGADDPFVPATEVEAFGKEMREGRVDWQFTAYGGAVHSFTDWNAGADPATGAAYHERSDRRSWEAMKVFFADLFP